MTELAQVAALEGRARVRRNGSWRDLAVGDALLLGDELDLRSKAVCQLGCGGAGRLTLRERARLTLGEDWQLTAGVCSLVAGDAPQRLRAGEVAVDPQPACEVALLHGSSGRLAIEVYVGGAEVRGAGAQVALSPGQGLEAKRGRLGQVRAARSPKWLRAARLPEGRVVFEEPCRSLRRGAYVVLLGHPTPEGLVSTPKPTAPRERAVSLGQGKRQGLFRAPSGARIHVQLTLESDQPVTVQLESPDRARAWRGVVPGKAGLNTIDLALSELRPKAGAELQGGEVLDFLSIQAGLPGQAHPLTLEYVRVYQPR
ncbi:MAG TPA: hypothetical protein DEA08_21900 [Planctomycetes bacterium]|nr:hypothetical protein [Planctomycetota bacterium]